MRVTVLGEFGLIARIAGRSRRSKADLVLGIGDDAAVWAPPSGLELATTDLLIENIHFKLDSIGWRDLGWKSMAVNLSDIAAMGGQPRFALLSIGLPDSVEVVDVEAFYEGATAVADLFNTTVVGGDTVRSPHDVVVNVALFGSATVVNGEARLIRRDAARVGDLVGVTGYLGASAGGLQMVMRDDAFPNEVADKLRSAHHRPMPRVREAQILLAAGVEAGMDVSDGLLGDLAKLCKVSGVSALVDETLIPVSESLVAAYPERSMELALRGGEDYELLFACSAQNLARAQEGLALAGLQTVTAIGEIVSGEPGKIRIRRRRGDIVDVDGSGYDAFGV